MSERLSKAMVFAHLTSWENVGEVEIVEQSAAYRSTFRVPGKKLALVTPYAVGEFYFDFFIGRTKVFSEWLELVDLTPSDAFDDALRVIKLFLYSEARVKEKEGFFGIDTLEVKLQSGWTNIFNGEP